MNLDTKKLLILAGVLGVTIILLAYRNKSIQQKDDSASGDKTMPLDEGLKKSVEKIDTELKTESK